MYTIKPAYSIADKDYNRLSPADVITLMYERTDKEGIMIVPDHPYETKKGSEGSVWLRCLMEWTKKDRDEVLKSDIVFVLLDGRVPDEGACVELGIAYASGKRCYGFKSDARSVEFGMDVNPMIIGCFEKYFYNIDGEKVIEDLKKYLAENKL